jgi:transposase-like protein
MTTPRDPIYAGHRYPAEIISYAVWLYFRFPLSLRMVEEMLAARGPHRLIWFLTVITSVWIVHYVWPALHR